MSLDLPLKLFASATIGMPSTQTQATPSFFEIDHPDEFAQFILNQRREIVFYLELLARQRSVATVYISDGQRFFLSSLLAIDETENLLFLDPSSAADNNALAQSAGQLTLVANLDRIKIQIRLPGLKISRHQDRDALCAPLPKAILRLQRREFFRLEPPLSSPVRCKLVARQDKAASRSLELILSDISGGGASLIGATEVANYFPRNALFQDCRLEIPGEGVIQVNLRVRKVIEISDRNGEHNLRIGCEFINLPGSRLAFIERYIARIERERKAHDTGLLVD